MWTATALCPDSGRTLGYAERNTQVYLFGARNPRSLFAAMCRVRTGETDEPAEDSISVGDLSDLESDWDPICDTLGARVASRVPVLPAELRFRNLRLFATP